jgi:Gpi18-like mannosyltransferase
LTLITLAGLGLRLFFIADPGHIVDLQTFGQWALAAADNPWDRAYEATNANYPPGALLFFELIGRAYRAAGLNDATSLRIALKVPNVLFDCVGGIVLFGIAARFVGGRRALLAAALFDWNPAIVYDSALWGQNDSITTVTALAALLALLVNRRLLAWVLLAFAVLNKPPVIVLAPLFLLDAWVSTDRGPRRRACIATGAGIVGAILCGYLVALPFYPDRAPLAVYARMLDWYRIGSSLYPYTSANAFNLFAFDREFFAADSAAILGIPIKYWADVAFGGLTVALLWSYARRPSARALVEAAFLTLLGFFLVLTEMHERYLIYALSVAPALAVFERRYLWATIVLSVTQWLNLEYSLTYMWIESDKPAGVDPDEFAPVLVHLCAAANLAVFGAVAERYFAPAARMKPSTGTALHER